jgi:hypothetical protein
MENTTVDQIPHYQVYHAITTRVRDQSTRRRNTHDQRNSTAQLRIYWYVNLHSFPTPRVDISPQFGYLPYLWRIWIDPWIVQDLTKNKSPLLWATCAIF